MNKKASRSILGFGSQPPAIQSEKTEADDSTRQEKSTRLFWFRFCHSWMNNTVSEINQKHSIPKKIYKRIEVKFYVLEF